MQLALMIGTTALVFLVLDALMLTTVMKPFFQARIGETMLASPRLVPAALFYAGYVAGVIWLVSLPALKAGSPSMAALNGAVLGAVAYGTYELTSHTILARWTWGMVALDLTWGTVLTGIAAWAGVLVARTLAG